METDDTSKQSSGDPGTQDKVSSPILILRQYWAYYMYH